MTGRTLLWGLVLLAAAWGCGRDHRDLMAQKMSEPASDDRGVAEGSGGSGDANEGPAGGQPGTGAVGGEASFDAFVLREVTLPGGEITDLVVDDGVVRRLVEGEATPEKEYSTQGYFVQPALVDSHVHLTYFPVAAQMAQAGVLAAVDLAAPLESLASPPRELELIAAGPMVTSVNGYPTQSWGRNGYGLEVSGTTEAEMAVLDLVNAGARVIKVPLDGDGSLTDEETRAVVESAHVHGLKVAAHANSVLGARRAAQLGCDVLAHTPTEKLPSDVVQLWSSKAVISTVRAFGASPTTQENLAALFQAGAEILYGTDLGNTRTPGFDVEELRLLVASGLSPREALHAATEAPADYWGIDVGRFQLGSVATFLVYGGDPVEELEILKRPILVVFRGQVIVDKTLE